MAHGGRDYSNGGDAEGNIPCEKPLQILSCITGVLQDLLDTCARPLSSLLQLFCDPPAPAEDQWQQDTPRSARVAAAQDLDASCSNPLWEPWLQCEQQLAVNQAAALLDQKQAWDPLPTVHIPISIMSVPDFLFGIVSY